MRGLLNYSSETLSQNPENTYHVIRSSLVQAQHKLSCAVNTAMVTAYWEIGKEIFNACGGNDRAEYGKKLLEYLSPKLTAEFGQGYTVRNLRAMRQFYCCFPIWHTVCAELSWSHYRVLMRISNDTIRTFYMEECVKSAWSVRQLERQINTMYYDSVVRYSLPENNNQIFASKYFTYLPTEEELKRELKLDDYRKQID